MKAFSLSCFYRRGVVSARVGEGKGGGGATNNQEPELLELVLAPGEGTSDSGAERRFQLGVELGEGHVVSATKRRTRRH